MNRKFDLILFDLDGTLFDTAESILNSIKGTVKLAGLKELTEEQLGTFIGPPVVTSIKGYYPELNDEEVDELTVKYRDYYINNEMLKAELFPGMEEVLIKLKANGYKVALATYKLMRCVIPLFEKKDVAKYFDTIRGSTAETGMTKTDIMRWAIEDCKVTDFDRICMIGDTEHDLRGAINLGVSFIGVKYGSGFKGLTEEEKNYNKIVAYVDNAIEILDYV